MLWFGHPLPERPPPGSTLSLPGEETRVVVPLEERAVTVKDPKYPRPPAMRTQVRPVYRTRKAPRVCQFSYARLHRAFLTAPRLSSEYTRCTPGECASRESWQSPCGRVRMRQAVATVGGELLPTWSFARTPAWTSLVRAQFRWDGP